MTYKLVERPCNIPRSRFFHIMRDEQTLGSLMCSDDGPQYVLIVDRPPDPAYPGEEVMECIYQGPDITEAISALLNDLTTPDEIVADTQGIVKPESGASEPILIGEMPEYDCHKRVRALKIARLEDDGVGGVTMHFETGDYRLASERLFARYYPKPGDYYVVYDDGYESISPAAAFEEGYTLVAPAGDPG